MLLPEKLQLLVRFIAQLEAKMDFKPKRGRPYTYSQLGMLLFFVIMQLKRIHRFKAMAKYIKYRYEDYGFPSPSNRKHRLLGIVPHRSIDTDASWSKSAYHGWRFGYGLHLVVNEMRFPLAALVTTASAADKHQLWPLLNGLLPDLHIMVGDAGYRAIRVIQQLWNKLGVFVLTFKPFSTSSKFKDWYNQWLNRPDAKKIYRHRKPSVEPTFALIKELFDLKGESQLPYRGLPKVRAYLLVCVAAIQLM